MPKVGLELVTVLLAHHHHRNGCVYVSVHERTHAHTLYMFVGNLVVSQLQIVE